MQQLTHLKKLPRFNVGPVTTAGNAFWNDAGVFQQTNTWPAGTGAAGVANVGRYYAQGEGQTAFFAFWRFVNQIGIINNPGDIWKLRQVGGNEIIGRMTIFGHSRRTRTK